MTPKSLGVRLVVEEAHVLESDPLPPFRAVLNTRSEAAGDARITYQARRVVLVLDPDAGHRLEDSGEIPGLSDAESGGGHLGVVYLHPGIVLDTNSPVRIVLDATIIDEHMGITPHIDTDGPVAAHDVADDDVAVGGCVHDNAGRCLAYRVAHVTKEHGVDVRIHTRRGVELDVAVGASDINYFGEGAGRHNEDAAILVSGAGCWSCGGNRCVDRAEDPITVCVFSRADAAIAVIVPARARCDRWRTACRRREAIAFDQHRMVRFYAAREQYRSDRTNQREQWGDQSQSRFHGCLL